MPCAITEMEKMARDAATRRVLSQEKFPEPRITRTICARRTIKRKVAGSDQNIICLAADFKWFLKSSILHFEKDLAREGNAATAFPSLAKSFSKGKIIG